MGRTNKKYEHPGRPVNHPPVMVVETGKIYETYTETAKAVNGDRWGVYRCATGLQKQHKGLHFEFVKE